MNEKTQDGVRNLEPTDMFRIVVVGDVQLAPDAREAAFVAQTYNREANQAETRICAVNTAGGSGPIALTAGPKDQHPRWSPAGDRLAFVSARTGKPQLHILERSGGEAWLLPTTQAVQSAPVWSPDGKRIAFTATTFAKGDEWVPYPGAPSGDRERAVKQAKVQLEKSRRNGTGGQREKNGSNPAVSDVKVIADFRFRFDGVGYFGDVKRHVFVIDVPFQPPSPGQELEAIEARQVTRGDYNHDNPAWSPDGGALVVTALREPQSFEGLTRQDLWIVGVDSGELTHLVDGDGPILAPTWSPDGHHIAFLGHDRRYGDSTNPQLWFVPVVRAEAPFTHDDCICVTDRLDRPVGGGVSSDLRYFGGGPALQWAGDSVYFTVGDRGAAGIFRYKAADLVHCGNDDLEVVVAAEGRSVSGFSTAPDGSVAFAGGDAEHPDDVFIVRSDGEIHRLTSVNDALLAEVRIAPVRKFTYKAQDEWNIDGWVLTPPGYQQGKRLPTVLFVHGGPHGAYGEGFMLQMQLVAAAGMAVVYTNPRGSQTYGQEFTRAVVGDWGGKDYLDIMAGVDAVIDMGITDPERLGVTGWSYGGYMTNWVVTQTSRFTAAVSGASIFNRHNFYGTSDITVHSTHWQGKPWNNAEGMLERSPIMYVENVTTPVMLLHGEQDLRCPIEQADQFYIALKRLGKPVVYVRYPDEFHGFRQPNHILDRHERLLAWFGHYLVEINN